MLTCLLVTLRNSGQRLQELLIVQMVQVFLSKARQEQRIYQFCVLTQRSLSLWRPALFHLQAM